MQKYFIPDLLEEGFENSEVEAKDDADLQKKLQKMREDKKAEKKAQKEKLKEDKEKNLDSKD